MTPSIRTIAIVVLFVCASATTTPAAAAAAPAAPAAGATQPILDQAALEKRFERTMSGAVLIGRFSDAARPDAQPKEDRYTIQRVSKIADDDGGGDGGDRWLFICRMQLGRNDISVPLSIPVKWAGDTPVISVTDMTIPGMGTYTARVMIYDDQYAGTWRGGEHGGHLWGRIERASTTQPTTRDVTR